MGLVSNPTVLQGDRQAVPAVRAFKTHASRASPRLSWFCAARQAALRCFLCDGGAAAAQLLHFVRHLPVTGRFILLFASTAFRHNTKAEPRVGARRPAGLPPCPTAGHMAVVARRQSSRRQDRSGRISSRRRSAVEYNRAIVPPLAPPPSTIKARQLSFASQSRMGFYSVRRRVVPFLFTPSLAGLYLFPSDGNCITF